MGGSGMLAAGVLEGDGAARLDDADGAPRAPSVLPVRVVTLRLPANSAGDLWAGGSTCPVGAVGAGAASTGGLIVVGVGGG